MPNDPRNYANDFANLLSQSPEAQRERGLPPIHPSDRLVNLAEEEGELRELPGSQNLFTFPKTKARVHLRQFNLSKPEDIAGYEAIENECIEKGWPIAREEWDFDVKNSTKIITLKYLEMEPKKKLKKEERERGGSNG